jgi:hypothetical protein
MVRTRMDSLPMSDCRSRKMMVRTRGEMLGKYLVYVWCSRPRDYASGKRVVDEWQFEDFESGHHQRRETKG